MKLCSKLFHNSLVSFSVVTPLVIALNNATNIVGYIVAYNTKCFTKICIARHIFKRYLDT